MSYYETEHLCKEYPRGKQMLYFNGDKTLPKWQVYKYCPHCGKKLKYLKKG
jgi:NADH pyrophosphatase NudC (nudix superfamily)